MSDYRMLLLEGYGHTRSSVEVFNRLSGRRKASGMANDDLAITKPNDFETVPKSGTKGARFAT